MQAIILIGGKGTRLSALYPDLPKALVPVAGKPFIQWQLEWLRAQGISSVHLATGHLSEAVQKWVEHNPIDGINISLSREHRPLGTGGGLKFSESFIFSDPFLVLNGDSLLPHLALQELISVHRTNHAIMTMAITQIQSAGRYGTVEFDSTSRVTAFLEKADQGKGWINGGVYITRRSLLTQIPSETQVSLETDIFPKLASAGELFALKTPPPLLDMGTASGIDAMERFLSEKPGFNGE